MRWKGTMPPIETAEQCIVYELRFCFADLTKTVDLPMRQVVHIPMIWTTCEECLDFAVTDNKTDEQVVHVQSDDMNYL